MTGQIVGDTEWNGLPMPRRLWAILAVTFGVALSVLDGTIANVALPTIAHELGVSSADSIWVVNAYQLAIVVSLLSFSTLSDVVGYRRIYIGGLVFFTLSSVGCAFAGSLEMLIAMRVIQGFGGAAVVSINTSIIRIIYPRDQLGRGMGINATVVAIASVAGPTLAAAILSMASWHWLFAINIPIGIAAVWLSMRFLPYNPVRLSDRRFDWRDGVMNALTFGLLIASVEGFRTGSIRASWPAARRRSAWWVISSCAASSGNPIRCCRSICCAFRSFRSRFSRRSAPSSHRCWLWWHCRSSYRRSWVTATSRPDFCSRRGQP